ncbi:hypothetical protein AMECASPLE_007127 [Ameca splendens]|uniref:Uncharacterized protein n=1 Tax=Ameca splendens TaxID=208324 RepID=A0ABV0XZH2_9TELE
MLLPVSCFSLSIFEQGVERDAAAELTEQKICLMLLEVCHRAGGCVYLRQIYHIIQGNEELLMSKLSGSTDCPFFSVYFDVSQESVDRTICFNPLVQFDHIGKKKLDQSKVVDWTWDWPRLLPVYEGISQVTFRSLIANRTTSPVPSSRSSLPLLLCNRHKYLCRYVTHIRLQYFRLFPVLHSQLSCCQLSGSYEATAPCLHAYAQSILNHCHCNTHTFLTKGKLCICQGHRPNKGEVRSTVLCCDEHCRLHASTSSSHIHKTHSSPPSLLFCCMIKQGTVIA